YVHLPATVTSDVLSRTLHDALPILFVDSSTATFDNKNAGSGKTVTASGFTLDGDEAGNYYVTTASLTDTASIFQKGLTLASIDDVEKAHVCTPTTTDTYGPSTG